MEKNKKYTIVDAGETLVMRDMNGKIMQKIGRYGVWIREGTVLTECIDTGRNLKKLKEQYHTDEVVKLNNRTR